VSILVLFHGVGANAGKTVLTRATCRWRSNAGRRVVPFKPVAVGDRFESVGGVRLDFRMWLLAAAARCEVGPDNSPVQVIIRPGGETGQLLVCGVSSGEIELVANDSPLLLPPDPRFHQAKDLIVDCVDRLVSRYDEVVVEGAGCAVDLGDDDLANLFVARLTGAPIVAVASAGAGGALTALAGLMDAYPSDVRRQLAGFALNDVRAGARRLMREATRLEASSGVRFLGGFPHAEIYDRIPAGEHSSLCDDEAEYEWLARRLSENLDLSAVISGRLVT